jgi:DNA-binding protein HU-beta
LRPVSVKLKEYRGWCISLSHYKTKTGENKMNKTELITAINEKTGITKENIKKVIDSSLDITIDKLAHSEKVQIVGFGTLEVVESAERIGRNPQNGEKITIPKCMRPKMTFSPKVKESVNK